METITKGFKEGEKVKEALLKGIVKILIDEAKLGRTITYSKLSEKINGAISPRGFYNPLVIISERAELNHYPKLSALVVNKQTGMPGDGFFDVFAGEIGRGTWTKFWENELSKIYMYDKWDSFLECFN